MSFPEGDSGHQVGVTRPDGFNVGLNLGKSAGGSLAAPAHARGAALVGDANFITVISRIKVVPPVAAATGYWQRRNGGPTVSDFYPDDPGGPTRKTQCARWPRALKAGPHPGHRDDHRHGGVGARRPPLFPVGNLFAGWLVIWFFVLWPTCSGRWPGSVAAGRLRCGARRHLRPDRRRCRCSAACCGGRR